MRIEQCPWQTNHQSPLTKNKVLEKGDVKPKFGGKIKRDCKHIELFGVKDEVHQQIQQGYQTDKGKRFGGHDQITVH